MIRAMLLSDNSEYAASTSTQYQYMFGENFLVAPVYQDTQADENGNDIRNGIYLPNYGTDENPTIWIDYFSGKQYRGGQVLNNYEAPLWKLPLFVKANAIVPMYAENNNPEAVSDTNTKVPTAASVSSSSSPPRATAPLRSTRTTAPPSRTTRLRTIPTARSTISPTVSM